MLRRVLILTCTAALPMAPVAQQSLLENPSFERANDAGWAEGWEIWPGEVPQGATLTVDREVAHSGQGSLRITHTRPVYTRGQQSLSVKPNTEYLFSCWIRCEDVVPHGGSQCARLYIEKSTGDRASRLLRDTTPWTKVEIGPVNVGETETVSVLCYLHQATGTVWFDDVMAVEVTDAVRRSREQQRVREIVKLGISQVRDMAVASGDQEALADLEAIDQRLATADLPTEVDHRAGPPYFPLHAEVFQVAADVNRRRLPDMAGPVQVWTTDPFEPFPAIGPVPEDRETDADVEMCLDDREQVLVRLCNIGQTEVSARLRVPEQPEEAPRVTVREVKCIHPGGVEMLKGDPLPLADLSPAGAASMSLPAGLMGGWWLQLDSDGGRPGLYRLPVTVTQEAGPPIEVQVRLRVLPVELPDEKSIVTWNYSYENYWIMPQRWDDARRDLVEHHVNAYCWPHPYLPWPELDEEGQLQPLDWSRFDAGLRTHDNIEWLLLWPGFEWEDNLRLTLDLEPGSERWREVFVAWFTAMREGLAQRGFGPDRVAWYLSDEPCNMQRAAAVKLSGEVIREIAPDAYVLANPYSAATQELLEMMDPAVNLWCPELSFASGQRLQFFREGSEILWSYQVLAKSRDAFESYRLGFWDCWHRGISGQGFWCYADAGGSAWDPWDAERHDYAPVYDGDERELIPSIRWEAWREGVEDYTLLATVAEALEEADCPEAARAAGRRALEAADEAVTERSPQAVASARRHALTALNIAVR